jgi:hypothetical protein
MEMSPARIVVAIVAIPLFFIAAVSSIVVFHQIVDAVNRRLPQDQQYDPLWWYWPKTRRLMTEYRRLYPEGALNLKYGFLVAAGVVTLFALAWAIGFFH